MSRATGATAQLLGKTESVYGTAPSGNWGLLPFISCDVGSEQGLVPDDTLGNGRKPRAPSRDVINVGGQVVVPVDARDIGFWLSGLFGLPDTDDAGDPVFVHTWESGADSLPTRALEVGHPKVPKYFKNLGLLVASGKFDLTPQGTTRATFEVVGQKETPASSSGGGTPSSQTFTRFSPFQGSVKRNGVALGNITAGEFTYNNGLDPVRVIRSDGLVEGHDLGVPSFAGKITTRFADSTLLDDATNGSAIAVEFAYTISSSLKLVVTAPEVYLPKQKISVSGPGGIEVPFDFQAAHNDDDGYMAQFVLTNDVEAYA